MIKKNIQKKKKPNMFQASKNAQIQLNNLRRIVFWSKREKLPKQDVLESGDQCCLFENEKDINENLEKQSEEKIEEMMNSS